MTLRLEILHRDLAHVASTPPNFSPQPGYYGQTRYNVHLVRSLRCLYWSNPHSFPKDKFLVLSKDQKWSSEEWNQKRLPCVTICALPVHAANRKEAVGSALHIFFREVIGVQELDVEDTKERKSAKSKSAACWSLSSNRSEIVSEPTLFCVYIATTVFADEVLSRQVQRMYYADRKSMGPADFLYVGGRFKPDLAHCSHFIRLADHKGKGINEVRMKLVQDHVVHCLLKTWDAKNNERQSLEQRWVEEGKKTPYTPSCLAARSVWNPDVPRTSIPVSYWQTTHPFWKHHRYSRPALCWTSLSQTTQDAEHLGRAVLAVPTWNKIHQDMQDMLGPAEETGFPLSYLPAALDKIKNAPFKKLGVEWIIQYEQSLAELRLACLVKRHTYEKAGFSTVYWSHYQEWNFSELLFFYTHMVPMRSAHPQRDCLSWTFSYVPDATAALWSHVNQLGQDAAIYLMSHMDLEMQHVGADTKNIKNHVLYVHLSVWHSNVLQKLQQRKVPYKLLKSLPTRTLCDESPTDKKSQLSQSSYSQRYSWYRNLASVLPQDPARAWKPIHWVCITGENEIKEFIEIVGDVHRFSTDLLLDCELGIHTILPKMKGKALLEKS